MATFVLEIRTEEIPANALDSAREQLEQGLSDRLTEAGVDGCGVRAWSTSRRLVVQVEDLPERQPDRQEEAIGPPRSVAFDAAGAPTKAAEGFARKVGLSVDRLKTISTAKGEYLAADVIHQGLPMAEVLARVVPEVVGSLRFPKMMRWGLGEHLFVRPVHGVVALLDGEVVPLELFGILAGRDTVGHRVHAPAGFTLGHARHYTAELERRGVVVDHHARRRMLEERAAAVAAEVGCSVRLDPALVAEHVELVEHPGLLRGSFDERFLELPAEVVITTLRHHQKCLVLERDDALAAFFVTVIDRADDPSGLIVQGNEWVIGARLADARFFFEDDRRHRLQELAPNLDRLEFHRRLGSVGDKARRVAELAGWMAMQLDAEVGAEQLRAASALAKADLSSHMVGEFPELQGVMGGHYLRLEGEPEELWTAARDHYQPQGFDGRIPASTTGRLLAAADRLDTVAALFAAGEMPSGSKDPFGMRRAAQGLVRIVAEATWNLDLHAAIRRAAELATQACPCDVDQLAGTLGPFVAQRIRRYLVDVVGVAGDTADAVLSSSWSPLPDAVARARALQDVRLEPEFRALALASKRVRNITDGQAEAKVDPALLVEDAEHELERARRAFHDRLAELIPARRLDEAFAAMGLLANTLDRFFVEVLVMTDDERVRANRIALLRALGEDFLALADLSKLQIEGGEQ